MPKPVITADTDLQIRRRCQRIPLKEKAKLIRILRQLSALDQRLADLHLFLPVVDIRFYGLGEDMLHSASLSPDKLLELIGTTR